MDDTLAERVVAAVRAGDSDALLQLFRDALGMPRHAVAPGQKPNVRIYRWKCPDCKGTGRLSVPDGERCHSCVGFGLIGADEVDPANFAPGELEPAPRPPAVMKSPCVDCAFRPGSPEEPGPYGDEVSCAHASYRRPGASTPFFCHHGMHRVGGGYESPAYVGSMPLGAMVCAGWWALATGEPLPDKSFRDPGGSNRRESAPEGAE